MKNCQFIEVPWKIGDTFYAKGETKQRVIFHIVESKDDRVFVDEDGASWNESQMFDSPYSYHITFETLDGCKAVETFPADPERKLNPRIYREKKDRLNGYVGANWPPEKPIEVAREYQHTGKLHHQDNWIMVTYKEVG